MSQVIHLTAGAFDQAAFRPTPVLLDFWAPWCGPCRMQGPILDEVARVVGNQALVAKINVDQEPELAARFGVQSLPTMVILKGGKIQKRMVGLKPAHDLVAALRAEGA